MLTLKIIMLLLCFIIACISLSKIVESALNLRAIHLGKKSPVFGPRTSGMVFNTKTGKLEADSQQILPFE